MEEEKNIELNYNQIDKLQNAINKTMELIGDINITGYSREKLRKDTQKSLIEAYDILFALNKYLKKLKGKMTNE